MAAPDVIGEILGLEPQLGGVDLQLAFLVLHLGMLAAHLAQSVVGRLHLGLQAAALFLQSVQTGLFLVEFGLQGRGFAAEGFGLLVDGLDAFLRPRFFLLALADCLLEFLDAAQHRRTLGLEALFQLPGGGELHAQLVELLGCGFLLSGLALGQFHGFGRLGVGLLDLTAASRDPLRQFLRLLPGRFEVLCGAFLLA
jgi:hypothetical protein